MTIDVEHLIYWNDLTSEFIVDLSFSLVILIRFRMVAASDTVSSELLPSLIRDVGKSSRYQDNEIKKGLSVKDLVDYFFGIKNWHLDIVV